MQYTNGSTDKATAKDGNARYITRMPIFYIYVEGCLRFSGSITIKVLR